MPTDIRLTLDGDVAIAVRQPQDNNEECLKNRFILEIPLDLGTNDDACASCGARHFLWERSKEDLNKPTARYKTCCQHGKVALPRAAIDTHDPNGFLREMYTSDSRSTRQFRDNTRAYNNALAFTSLGTQLDAAAGRGRGIYCFRISGELRHYVGPLIPSSDTEAKFAQIFVVGDSGLGELHLRQASVLHDLNLATLERWQQFIISHNPYAQFLKMAREVHVNNPNARLVLRTVENRKLAATTYNRPTVDEISMVISSDNEEIPARDIVLHMRDGGLKRVTDLHSGYLALRYPILFPYGEQQWHPNASNLRSGRGDSLTQLEWYAFLLFERNTSENFFIHAKRLYQEFLVDLYVCIERSRLNFIRRSQGKLKIAQYQGVLESLGNETDIQGKKVILPSTFIGSPRAMIQIYQDAMALVKEFGPPSLFITMTGNPQWPEIIAGLKPGQIPSDRPDLISTVFHLKLKILIDDLTKNKRLGPVKSYVYTIEFQKRGMPHAHIILILEHDFRPITPEQIDNIVTARLPDPGSEPDLYKLVTRTMLHGPCREGYRCWTPKGCQYQYPKPFVAVTSLQQGEFPIYSRPDDNRIYVKAGHTYTNQDVVPYNKYLLLRHQCHINVEIPVNLKAVKYLYKYICKGEDRTQLDVLVDDETTAFVDGRYVGPSEAVWRIFQYPLSDRSPTVVRLSLHLNEQQVIGYTSENGLLERVTSGSAGRTTLTEYFALNKANAIGQGMRARSLLYQDIPKYFRWDSSAKLWLARKQRGGAIGRLFFARITEGERSFLRLILLHRKSATSFDDLKKVRGVSFPSFRLAAEAMGLLQSDEDYNICLQEAATFMTGRALRQMFVTMLTMNSLANPQDLYIKHQGSLSDDCLHILKTSYDIVDPTEFDVNDLALNFIDHLLLTEGKNLEAVGLARPDRDLDRFSLSTDESTAPGRVTFLDFTNELYATLTPAQASVFDTISEGLEGSVQTLTYLDGPGGSGKTYLLNVILGYCEKSNYNSMAVSSSGISALLLRNGKTAHTGLGVPLACHEQSTCSWLPTDSKATEISKLKLLVWDEVSMQHRYNIEAVDRSLQDLKKKNAPFGGLSVLFSGDFRQTLPVIRRGNIYDQARASLKRSKIWKRLEIYSLTTNLRLNLHNVLHVDGDHRANLQFSDWLLNVGEGVGQTQDIQKIPILHVSALVETTVEKARSKSIEWVYNDLSTILNRRATQTISEFYAERSIITPLNVDVKELNDKILSKINGRCLVSTSIDQVSHDSPQSVGEEILHSLNHPGFPSHVLRIKVNMVVMLIRNLNIGGGLCNGTRLLVQHMKSHVLQCIILNGAHAGESVLIPKITLTYEDDNDFGVSFQRYQFPLTPAFAMTINKSQGQGFNRVSVFMPNPVFSHGQLYVALSRTRSVKDIQLSLVDNSAGLSTHNVVCREVVK